MRYQKLCKSDLNSETVKDELFIPSLDVAEADVAVNSAEASSV